MPKVRATVNLMDANFKCVTLHAGDEIPEWALDRITNPSLVDDSVAETVEVAAQPIVPVDASSARVEVKAGLYDALKKDELIALANERGIDATGNKPDIIARLEAADAAATSEGDGDVDVWSLDVAELQKLAADRGIDLGDASTTAEMATIIDAAGE